MTDGNGGGCRGSPLLPISCIYNNTSLTSLLIEIKVERTSGDDKIEYLDGSILTVQEYVASSL